MGVSAGQILRQTALRAPEATALVDAGHDEAAPVRSFTYAELDRSARRVAAELRALGVREGDRVALLAESSAELATLWFGIVYAGAAVVPLAVLSAAPEVAFRLEHARSRLLIHDAARHGLALEAKALATDLAVELHVASELCGTRREPVAFPADTGAEATAMVLYTSGTTGKPKGAAISHASLVLHTATLAAHSLRLGPEDVVLCTLPLSHSYGCRMAMLAPFYARAKVVVTARFSAARTLALMQEHAVTWVPAVPTMFAAWAADGGGAQPDRLRWALSAGAPLADEICRRAEARLGATVRQGYGMTEATFAAMNAPPDERVVGSVGRPTWGVELRVVDPEGRDVAPGETGEVLVRGHNVMTHYLFDPEATLDATQDGFMHTGDVGRFDAQGHLWLVDRKKDLIIRGGHNVYPSEVEDVIAAYPEVAEVAVIGRPDAYYGEEIVAVIVAAHGQVVSIDALADFVRTRLSRTKQPRHYAQVPALPQGPSGKVQKRELRAWLEAGKLCLQPAQTARPQPAPTARPKEEEGEP